MGVNPGTWPIGNHSAWYAYGTAGEGIGCGYYELPTSFLALLLVILLETKLLRVSY